MADSLLKFDSYAGFKNPICNFHTSNQLKIDATFLCDQPLCNTSKNED